MVWSGAMITVCALPLVGRNVLPVATGVGEWGALGDAVAAPTTPVPATRTSAHPQRSARCVVRLVRCDIDMRSPSETGQVCAGVVWGSAWGEGSMQSAPIPSGKEGSSVIGEKLAAEVCDVDQRRDVE